MGFFAQVTKIIGDIFGFVGNPLGALGAWVFNSLLGSPTNPKSPLGFLFLTLTGQINPAQISQMHALYMVLAPSSIAILTFIAGLRVLKLWLGLPEGTSPTMVLMDVVPKWGIMVVLLAPPTNIAYHLFGFFAVAFSKIGYALMGSLLGVTAHVLVGGIAKIFLTDIVLAFLASLTPFDPMLPAIVVFGLLLAFFLAYLVWLMFMRSMILIFCLILMPLALPIALYDPQNGFYKWWLGSATGALAAQIVACVGFAVTLTISLGLHGIGPLQTAESLAMMAVGLALTDKLVKAAESGTVGGAGMGAAGLVDIAALGPRAFRNVFGNVGSGRLSQSFTRLGGGQGGRLSEGDGGGAPAGGGGGGGGWGMGERGALRGLFFPRHAAFADAVGVATLTGAGAIKGAMHPPGGFLKPTEARGQSIVFGSQAGARMAMGMASVADASRAISPTKAGRHVEARLAAHWAGIDSALTSQAGVAMAAAQASHDELMGRADAMAGGQADDQVRAALRRSGHGLPAASSVEQPARDEAAATVRHQAQATIADVQAQADQRRATAEGEFNAMRQQAVAQGLGNVQSRSHPARVGRAAQLTKAQDADLDAQLKAHAQRYGAPPQPPKEGK